MSLNYWFFFYLVCCVSRCELTAEKPAADAATQVFYSQFGQIDNSITTDNGDDDDSIETKIIPPDNTKESWKCSFPALSNNGTGILDSRKLSHVTSVHFKVIEEGKTQSCTLECRNGKWFGPVCDGEEFNYGCRLSYISPDVEGRLNHSVISITDSPIELAHGTHLRFRCTDEKRHLNGRSIVSCENGMLSSRPPICQRTSGTENYSEGLAPRVEWHVTGSPHARGREGELIVYAGAILHIDCIFDRRRGTPQWSWSHDYREYPTGWMVSTQDRNWKFRVSIVYAKHEDSGSFNCTTPRGIQNSLVITVTSTLCPLLKVMDHHRTNSSERHIGSSVSVTCPTGFHSVGSNLLTCRDDGTWSSEVPVCSPVTCPPLEISSPHLRVLRLNNSYLGEAEFDCPFGYKLVGEGTIWCNHLSKWSASVPSCKAIECPAPIPPPNGQMIDHEVVHYVGATVQSVCHAGYILIGEPIIRCTQHGIWSDSTPICRKACGYPGTPQLGAVYPLKFIYEVGEQVKITCDSGSVSIGENVMECLPSGDWSRELPKCENYL